MMTRRDMTKKETGDANAQTISVFIHRHISSMQRSRTIEWVFYMYCTSLAIAKDKIDPCGDERGRVRGLERCAVHVEECLK